MCGIVGAFMHDGGVSRWQPHIEHAMHLMARRGPDASGFWSDGGRCAFGFRRLSILDLSPAGNQPMLTDDGRYVLVYNGELYNFREIREGLQDRGVSFRSTGDTEVVLHALAAFGDKALTSFNGMFALAFYDTHAQRLLLARDHAGIKPLYVLQHREGVFFASQYNQICSHPWARTQAVSPGSLALYLNLGYIPPPYALLDGTVALEAGTWMAVDGSGHTDVRRHFSFPRLRAPDLYGAAAHEAVDAAIESAVDRASMHHSLEVRVPLLDRDVIDVAIRVDWRSCVDLPHEIGKLPLRASLQRHAGFQTTAKRGFTPPMASWLRGPLRPLFKDMVLSRRELLGLPFDRTALTRVFRRHRLRLESSTWLLWRLLSLALWESRHFRPAPAHA